MRPRRVNNRGMGLVISMIVLTILSLLSVAIYQINRYQMKESVFHKRMAQAHYISQAALEEALYQLSQDPSWTTGISNKAFAGGTYSVTVSSSTPPIITATGYSPHLRFFGPAVQTIEVEADVSSQAATGCVLWTNNKFKVDGIVDSYDSSVELDPSTFTFGGHVCSNKRVQTKNGQIRIRGNVVYRTNNPPNAATVEGTIKQSTYSKSLPTVDASPYESTNDNSTGISSAWNVYNTSNKRLTIGNNKNALLQPGTYYFSRVKVQGRLNLNTSTAPVIIYTEGNFNVTNNALVVNQSSLPSRFRVYCEGNINFNINQGTVPFHAVIQNPQGKIVLKRDFFGSMVAREIQVKNNGKLHFDRSLNDGTDAGDDPVPTGWVAGTWRVSYKRQ